MNIILHTQYRIHRTSSCQLLLPARGAARGSIRFTEWRDLCAAGEGQQALQAASPAAMLFSVDHSLTAGMIPDIPKLVYYPFFYSSLYVLQRETR